jgi:4-hydroxythreonine-4-phosphate dehydrogenase
MSPVVLAITLGDVAGIGPEIVLPLLDEPVAGAHLLVVGSEAALARARAWIPGPPLPPTVGSAAEMVARNLPAAILRAPPTFESLPAPGQVSAPAGAASHAWVVTAARMAHAGQVAGLVTAPIHKGAWHAAGLSHPGHTELLREVAGSERVVMCFVAGRLRAALATIHVPLRSVPDLLDAADLLADLRILAASVPPESEGRPARIAVCGLNPHAGEGGLFGSEDAEIIAPAVAAAREAGLDVVGPLPADAVLPAAVAGRYDAVLGMYHDQILPTVKSVAPRKSVNVTLGLPFVRTSVDHGTAFDIAGSGQADASAMRVAVEEAIRMAPTPRGGAQIASGGIPK